LNQEDKYINPEPIEDPILDEEIVDDFPEGATVAERETIMEIASHYQAILQLIGEDPEREGLLKTPLRAARALWYETSGNRCGEPADLMRKALFTHEGSRMVVVRDIEFYSLCEHHILPFFGTVSVGYIPDGRIVGLSKLARVVNAVARKLQVQERMTAEICQAVEQALSPLGVIATCRASHLCMQMRGVEKQMASTVTTHYSGIFESDASLREEFFRLTTI
jgi:GTP cyclohydrolase I